MNSPALDPVETTKNPTNPGSPVYGFTPDGVDIVSHTFAVLVENEPGVLARIVGLFSGRGYNIDSLTVAEVDEAAHLSRITVVTTGTLAVITQIKQQIARLVPVLKVVDMTATGRSIERELALVKVKAGLGLDAQVLQIAERFNARVLQQTPQAFIFEITSLKHTVGMFIDRLRDYGLIETSRTGVAAITSGDEALFA